MSRIDLVKTINKRRRKRAGPVVSFAGCGRTTLFHSSASTQIDARLCNLFMELYIALPLVTFYFYFISSSRSLHWKQELFLVGSCLLTLIHINGRVDGGK